MDIEVVDEDSIDTETLQAQIDLSMSFAQSLVSSWMEPHRFPTSSRKKDLEQELSEYMKRPPRLGVGASIPEGHQNMTREAARLKGKLTGSSKRRHEGEGEASAPAKCTSDDDDDESRAGAIKKKQKSDPFDILHGKKKKRHHAKDDVSEPTLSVAQSSSQDAQGVRKSDTLTAGTQSPSKKQKRSKQESLVPNEDLSPLQDLALEEDSSTLINNGHSSKPESRLVVTSPSRRSLESGPTSPTPNATALYPKLLKRPLLNLSGPPVNSDDDESDAAGAGASESPLTSPKKKRKRRRKKKHLITETSCHSTATSTVAPSTTTFGDLET